MNKYLLILLAIAMNLTSVAQGNFEPMVVEGRIWNVVKIHYAEPPESDSIGYYQDIQGRWGIGWHYTFMLKGDTIMGGTTYKKLFLDDMFVSGLREEDGRVYERYWDDVPEQLIFDFYLQPGDIFKDEVDDMFQMEVKQVREVDVDGKSRQCMDMWAHLEGMEIVDGLVDYWIEGIGCMNGPHFPFWWEAIGPPSLLLSCYDGDECIFTIEDLKQFTSNPSSCPDDNHPHAIDLGLPSGTKWACCNVGADKPEAYGGYYAWGETEEKEVYDWASYTLCEGRANTSQNLGSDIAGTSYDVAHVKWGGGWQMPSMEQLEELIQNCPYIWTVMDGVNGTLFTGSNGGTLFMPAAGQRWKNESNCVGNNGFFWTSTQLKYSVDDAYSLMFFVYDAVTDFNFRGLGFSVRPIMNDASNINLPKSSSEISNQAVFNLFGIKVADSMDGMKNLSPGIYVVDGKKVVVK